MADTKISALTELTSVASNDELVVVDKSDTTMAASGTSKRISVPTLLASVNRSNHRLGALLCGDRNRPGASQLSNGTDTSATTKVAVLAPPGGATNVRVEFWNWTLVSGAANTFTLKAAIEYAGTVYPLYFRGKRTTTVDVKGFEVSDPLPINLPAGATFYVRSYVSVSSGETWPKNLTSTFETIGSDLTASGAAAVTTVTARQVFSPSAVLAGSSDTWPKITVFGIGDSNMYGQGTANAENSPFRTGLWTAGIPMMNAGKPGMATHEWAGSSAGSSVSDRYADLGVGAKYTWIHFGTNSIGAWAQTTAQTIASLVEVVGAVNRQGQLAIVNTIPPRTTSTDSWATTGNQTVLATEATRLAVNVAIRAGIAGAWMYYDYADVLETARDSGKWKSPSYTSDGIHADGASALTDLNTSIATFATANLT